MLFRFLEKSAQSGEKPEVEFEIFLQPRYSQLELASVTTVLETANDVQNKTIFRWRTISDEPGLVGKDNLLVRAEPANNNDCLKQCLIVVGGQQCDAKAWLPRVRAMERLRRPVLLLSNAATSYIQKTASLTGTVTTHWGDLLVLRETGDFPELSNNLVENNNGLLTCAGKAHTLEVMIEILSEILCPEDTLEIANRLIIGNLRRFNHEQPASFGGNNLNLDLQLLDALEIMEQHIEEPILMAELAQLLGTSTRQLERLFQTNLQTSPGRMYRKIRLKRARRLISETRMPLIDIAISCGFASTSTMAKVFRLEYGQSPKRYREANVVC